MSLKKDWRIERLIGHLKHEDIHLYEALIVLQDSLQEIGTTGDVFDQDEVIFNLGAGGVDISTGVAVAPPRVITNENKNLLMVEWVVQAGVPSLGSNLVLRITKNGLPYQILTYPMGSTSLYFIKTLTSNNLKYHDYFNVDVVGVGTGCRKVFISGKYKFTGSTV